MENDNSLGAHPRSSSNSTPSSSPSRSKLGGGGVSSVSTQQDEYYYRVPGSEHEEADDHISYARSFEDSMEEEDDDDDENDIVLRRYHTRVEVTPVEFDTGNFPVIRRVWHSLEQERIAARQRRAARLLANADTTLAQRVNSFCVTWFCDATDRGIILAAILCALWLAVGTFVSAKRPYWVMGVVLFTLRISARRITESIKRRRSSPNIVHQYSSPMSGGIALNNVV